MTRQSIESSVAAAHRIIELASRVTYSRYHATPDHRDQANSGPLTGELRRASMDLTRRLAEMRRS